MFVNEDNNNNNNNNNVEDKEKDNEVIEITDYEEDDFDQEAIKKVLANKEVDRQEIKRRQEMCRIRNEEMEKEKEKELELEREREMEMERQKEMELEMKKERERELEREWQAKFEIEKEKERQLEREKELELEKEMELEKEKEKKGNKIREFLKRLQLNEKKVVKGIEIHQIRSTKIPTSYYNKQTDLLFNEKYGIYYLPDSHYVKNKKRHSRFRLPYSHLFQLMENEKLDIQKEEDKSMTIEEVQKVVLCCTAKIYKIFNRNSTKPENFIDLPIPVVDDKIEMPDDCDARNFCFRIVYVTNGVEFARRLISFKNLSTLQSDYRKENKSTSRKEEEDDDDDDDEDEDDDEEDGEDKDDESEKKKIKIDNE
jgi:hypothetical protein